MKNDRRIRILPTNEIDDLFARPCFSKEERFVWFDLTPDELFLLQQKASLANKVDLILQLGYFKAKHQFFNFTLEDVQEDVDYIINTFFSGQILKKLSLSRTHRYRNQLSILNLMNITLFDAKTHIPVLLEYSHSLCRISNDPFFLFRNLFEYLKTNKITIPGYTNFQEHIVSVAFNRENESLYAGLSPYVSG